MKNRHEVIQNGHCFPVLLGETLLSTSGKSFFKVILTRLGIFTIKLVPESLHELTIWIKPLSPHQNRK